MTWLVLILSIYIFLMEIVSIRTSLWCIAISLFTTDFFTFFFRLNVYDYFRSYLYIFSPIYIDMSEHVRYICTYSKYKLCYKASLEDHRYLSEWEIYNYPFLPDVCLIYVTCDDALTDFLFFVVFFYFWIQFVMVEELIILGRINTKTQSRYRLQVIWSTKAYEYGDFVYIGRFFGHTVKFRLLWTK